MRFEELSKENLWWKFGSEFQRYDRNLRELSEVIKSTITINPIFNWLMAGLVPVFFFDGQYILCNNFIEHEEKINYLRDIKITLMGFSLWLVVIMGIFLF